MDPSADIRRSGRRKIRPVEFWNFENPDEVEPEDISYNVGYLCRSSVSDIRNCSVINRSSIPSKGSEKNRNKIKNDSQDITQNASKNRKNIDIGEGMKKNESQDITLKGSRNTSIGESSQDITQKGSKNRKSIEGIKKNESQEITQKGSKNRKSIGEDAAKNKRNIESTGTKKNDSKDITQKGSRNRRSIEGIKNNESHDITQKGSKNRRSIGEDTAKNRRKSNVGSAKKTGVNMPAEKIDVTKPSNKELKAQNDVSNISKINKTNLSQNQTTMEMPSFHNVFSSTAIGANSTVLNSQTLTAARVDDNSVFKVPSVPVRRKLINKKISKQPTLNFISEESCSFISWPENTNNQSDITAIRNKSDFTATQNDLTATRNDLTATQNDLTATQNDLTATRNDLTAIRNDLTITQNDLTAIKNKSDLTATQNDLTAIRNTSDNLTAIQNDLTDTQNYITESQMNTTQIEKRNPTKTNPSTSSLQGLRNKTLPSRDKKNISCKISKNRESTMLDSVINSTSNDTTIRRSGRVRTRPLEFWNFEKANMTHLENGEVSIMYHKLSTTHQSFITQGQSEQEIREYTSYTRTKTNKSMKSGTKGVASVPSLNNAGSKTVSRKRKLCPPGQTMLDSSNVEEDESSPKQQKIMKERGLVTPEAKIFYFDKLRFVPFESRNCKFYMSVCMMNKKAEAYFGFIFIEDGKLIWTTSKETVLLVIAGSGSLKVTQGNMKGKSYTLNAEAYVTVPSGRKINLEKDGDCELLKIYTGLGNTMAEISSMMDCIPK